MLSPGSCQLHECSYDAVDGSAHFVANTPLAEHQGADPSRGPFCPTEGCGLPKGSVPLCSTSGRKNKQCRCDANTYPSVVGEEDATACVRGVEQSTQARKRLYKSTRTRAEQLYARGCSMRPPCRSRNAGCARPGGCSAAWCPTYKQRRRRLCTSTRTIHQ